MTIQLEAGEFAALMDACVGTQTLTRKCARCGTEISNGFGRPRKYCVDCNVHRNAAREMQSTMKKELRVVLANIVYSYLNRDRYFSFDGRYEGPLNKSITFVMRHKKDKGYHPMPVDVHVEPAAPKFTMVTIEDVEWGKKQGRTTQQMPRRFNSFCADCVEVVIDRESKKVRVTKGVYLSIEHECKRVRFYNLHGALLEVQKL